MDKWITHLRPRKELRMRVDKSVDKSVDNFLDFVDNSKKKLSTRCPQGYPQDFVDNFFSALF